MKITDIQTFGVNLGDENHLFVKVLTDQEIYGIGEAYRVGPDLAVEQIIHYLKDWLIGQDPTRIEYLWRLMYNGSRFPGGSMLNAAISGIEVALWDVKGKAHDSAVYQLIGGRCRDRVRAYLGIGGHTPHQIADAAQRAVRQHGFTAIKMCPQPPGWQQMPWGQVRRETVQRLEAVRNAIGDDIDVALDPHAQIFEPFRALDLAELVKPYHPLFLEEPLRPENRAALAGLRSRTTVPIATGEMLYTKYEFQDLIAAGAADILQPDILLCGGLWETKKIAALAESNYLDVAPHSPLGPVSTAAAVQFAAATGNFLILEYRIDCQGPMRDLVVEPLKFVDGYVQIPQTAGLGVDLNLSAFQDQPLKPWRRPLIIESDGNIGYP